MTITARRLTGLAWCWFVFGILEAGRTVALIVLAPQINQSWSQWSAASRWTDLLLVVNIIRGRAYPTAPVPGPGFIEWLQTWSAAMVAFALVAAFGLYKRARWGRSSAIIAALFGLFHPILGTILAIYTLSLLSPAEAGLEYQRSLGE